MSPPTKYDLPDYAFQAETCGSCGLTHRRVEASGRWHCPNPACVASGAAWFRSKLPGTRNEETHHYVDEGEWAKAVADWIVKAEEDRLIQDAAYASLQKLKEKHGGGE